MRHAAGLCAGPARQCFMNRLRIGRKTTGYRP
jgi:hypothetical protein